MQIIFPDSVFTKKEREVKQKLSPGKHPVFKTIFIFILTYSLVTEWVTPNLACSNGWITLPSWKDVA